MALADPFGVTYAGAFKGVSSFGEALGSIAESYSKRKEAEAEQEAKIKLEKEKAKIKAETPSFLEQLMLAMDPDLMAKFKAGVEGETPTGQLGVAPTGAPTAQLGAPTAQPGAPVLQAQVGGGTLGDVLQGGLIDPQIDPALSMKLKYDPLQMDIGKAQIGLAEKKAAAPIKGLEKIATKKGEFIGGVEVEPFKAYFNTELSGNLLNAAAVVHAKAFEEGGIGSMANALESSIALFWGGRGAEKYAATQSLPGKYTESLLKMMPIFTQQVGKEGTIRIIQGIFEKMGQTLPTYDLEKFFDKSKRIPPKNARMMLESTLDTLIRVARATEFLQVDIQELKKQEGESEGSHQERLDRFANVMAERAGRINFSPEEQAARDSFIANALKPIDDFIAKRDKKESELPTFVSEEQADASGYKGEAIIGGRKARID